MIDISSLKSLTAEQLDNMEQQELRDALRTLVETMAMLMEANNTLSAVLEGQKDDDK